MIARSQEISLKKKDFFLNKVIVLYGENQDLINDLNDQIISLCEGEGEGEGKNKNSKVIFEDDILKKPDDIINYYLNGSLFDEDKKILDEKMDAVKKVKDSEDLEAIKAAGEDLSKEAQRVGGAMYAKSDAAANAGAEGASAAAPETESTAKDAEFTEKKDDDGTTV